jgi:hypothetical protein
VKLPPLALTAPSLCPRCDAPAMFDDHCVQCALPLRLCGACRGVAGPFDRYCGFCGYELVQGDKRAAVWRLWLLAALIPLAAGLAFGLSPLALKTGILTGFANRAPQTPSQMQALRSANLGFTYAVPNDWTATDYTKAGAPQPFVVVSRLDADRVTAANLGGELITAQPAGVAMTLGRPPLDVSAVDSSDPLAVLAFQVSQLVATPPAGVTYRVVKPVHAISVGGKPGAEVVIEVVGADSTTYYERAYVATSTQALFRAEAVAPASDWESGDGRRVESVIQSLAFR